MRVTRKVFSNYSETEDLISAIEERAFCEGYQAAQREFAKKNDELTENQKLGIAALGLTSATGAGMYGLSKYEGRGVLDKTSSSVRNLVSNTRNSKLGKLLGVEESKGEIAKNKVKRGKEAILDTAENLGKKIKNAWGEGHDLASFKKNAKGRAAIAGITLAPAAATVGAKKAYDYYKNKNNKD